MFLRIRVQFPASPPRRTWLPHVRREPRLTRPHPKYICDVKRRIMMNIFMTETSDVSDRYYVYILKSLKDCGLYIGYTTDLKKGLVQHAKAQSTVTKFRTPFKLIHYAYFINKADAKAREEFLKSGYGRKQLKQILKNTFLYPLTLPHTS